MTGCGRTDGGWRRYFEETQEYIEWGARLIAQNDKELAVLRELVEEQGRVITEQRELLKNKLVVFVIYPEHDPDDLENEPDDTACFGIPMRVIDDAVTKAGLETSTLYEILRKYATSSWAADGVSVHGATWDAFLRTELPKLAKHPEGKWTNIDELDAFDGACVFRFVHTYFDFTEFP